MTTSTADTQLSFHHVGLACKSLAQERSVHLALGFVDEGPVFEDPVQRIRGQFLLHGTFRIELLEPLGEDSPLGGYLKRGIKMYHQAFLVKDIRAAIAELTAGGSFLLVGPVPAVAFGGRNIAFLAMPGALIVELIER